MFEKLKKRWESEESKLGKFLKYYIGYIGMASGFISGTLTDISSQYAALGCVVPVWITKTLLYAGIAGYVVGKITRKKDLEHHN